MTPFKKSFQKVMSGGSDENVRFDELCLILRRLGSRERIVGSHHVFSFPNIPQVISIQPRKDGSAKPYQVRQVRQFLTNYSVTPERTEDDDQP